MKTRHWKLGNKDWHTKHGNVKVLMENGTVVNRTVGVRGQRDQRDIAMRDAVVVKPGRLMSDAEITQRLKQMRIRIPMSA